MIVTRDINRNAATPSCSSTGVGPTCAQLAERRRRLLARHDHRRDRARHHGATLIRMVLAVTFETSPDQRLPLQYP